LPAEINRPVLNSEVLNNGAARWPPPPGYEEYNNVAWHTLTPNETIIAMWFADCLREIRRNETELMRKRIGHINQIAGISDALIIEHYANKPNN
jgi:hypothetical protein